MTEQRKLNWLERNWKWCVPVGCLSIILLTAAFAVSILVFVFGIMRQSDVYKNATAIAEQDRQVVEALGSPVEKGWFVSGQINVTGPSGHAEISIPISGPHGKGTIYAVADKQAGRWVYQVLEVEIKGRSDRIKLQTE